MRTRASLLGQVGLALVLLGGAAGAEPPAPPAPPGTAPEVVDDFQDAGDRWRFENVGLHELTLERGASPSGGGGALEVTGPGSKAGWLRREVPPSDWRSTEAVTLTVALEAAGEQPLRLIVGTGGRRHFVRRFKVAPGPWHEVTLRLADFRDGNHHLLPDFARVDRLEIRWDAGEGKLRIDDLKRVPGTRGAASCLPTLAERLRFAFPDGKGKAVEGTGFALLTDVPALHGEGGRKLLARLEEGRKTLVEAFRMPEAPAGTPAVPLHVFATRDAYVAFVARLGEHFGASIAPPTADGFTILRLPLSSYDAAKGWDRPVFVHEAVHGALCAMLGFASDGNWIQEGVASAVQARLHPSSVKNVDFAGAFAGKRKFLPWSQLFEKPAPAMSAYAQLLTILEFLADEHADRLPEVWKAITELESPPHKGGAAAIAKALGLSAEDLEKAWLAWGRAKHPAGG
jgi:hypothetical protein